MAMHKKIHDLTEMILITKVPLSFFSFFFYYSQNIGRISGISSKRKPAPDRGAGFLFMNLWILLLIFYCSVTLIQVERSDRDIPAHCSLLVRPVPSLFVRTG